MIYTKKLQTNSISAIFLIVLLIISAISFAGRRDGRKEFWLANSVEMRLRNISDTDSFENVTNIENLISYLNAVGSNIPDTSTDKFNCADYEVSR